ncbi:MAG: helix-turn-helix domain-containing protein [Ketobacter sp.]|nr:helix-turn-helix domain-containing protein [Ketobacter sp.]
MTALPGKPAANASPDNGSGVDKLLASSPGARLQRAREAANLTVNEAADALHLSPGVVKALEADDYRALPNATFVKGYLRSYSRLLGIGGEELVRSYEAITGSGKPQPVQPIETPRTAPRFATPLRFGLLGLVVVMVAYLLWPASGEPEAVAPLAEDAAAPQGEAVIETTPAVDAESEAPVTPPDQPAADSLDTEVSLELEREALVSSEPMPEEAEAAEAENIEPVIDPDTPAPEPDAAEVMQPALQAAADLASDAALPDSQVTAPQGQISMAFTGDCWVEIRDASGALIYSNLRRNGESLSITGEPPLEAKLGNGNVVSVRYNGQPVSFRVPPHNVVRVRLGE